MTDQTPEATLTEQDEKDLATLLGEGDMTYNPVLRIWKEVLSDGNIAHGARVSIPWSTAMVSKYAGMTFALMPAFVERYFQIITDLAHILREEIAADPDCLDWHTLEEDVEENAGHYRTLLLEWQKRLLTWELGWDCTHPDAAAHVAALGEISAFFFGETGLTGHLSSIGFEFTEADQKEMGEALMAHQETLLKEAEGE